MAAGLLIPLSIVVLLGVVGIGGFILVRRDAAEAMSSRFGLRAYLHLASVICTLVVAFGITSLLTAVLATAAGRSFSYYTEMPWFPGATAPYGAPERDDEAPQRRQEEMRRRQEAQAEFQFQDDLVRGIALTAAGLLLWGLHSAGLRAVESGEEREGSWLNRLHRAALLAVFGVGVLVALPLGTYELARHYLVAAEGSFRTPPGSTVASAIVFVPVWLYELWRVVRTSRQLDRSAEPA